MNSVEKYILEKYRHLIENLGYSFYHVEFQKSHKDTYLRLFIEPLDGTQTMDIDACETVSRACSDAFDQDAKFPIDDAYILEVSSPGIERTLYVPEHFQRYIGEKIRLGLYKSVSKKKEFVSILKYADNTGIKIEDNGVIIDLDYKDISKAQLYCDF
ncbi:MAG: ribosome maturation factor RimP [Peptococcaceae bacterium]|nr:ribosome maturation factor RimP [Peptococcaceae bacterium]